MTTEALAVFVVGWLVAELVVHTRRRPGQAIEVLRPGDAWAAKWRRGR